MNSTEIIQAVLRGDADDNLDGIADATRERRKTVAHASFFTYKPGDRVRLVNLRPKYLVGLEATVVRRNKSRIVVTLDNPPPGGRFSGEVTASPNMIEAI